jgi:hypothetical protein
MGETRTLYINALTTGLEPFSVTGGLFSVSGLPVSWTTSIAVDQNAVILGNPFAASGVDIAFFTPRSGACVNLLSVDVTATSEERDKILSVIKASPLVLPQFDCPIVKIDCAFCVPYVCVDGGSLFVNSSSSCSVRVVDHTWSAVKQLF